MTERRTFSIDRAASNTVPGGVRFKGHAAVFGQRTWIGPPGRGFWEEVSTTAFDRALQEDDVRFLLEHDPRWILGRTSSGTLRLGTDKQGLAVEADFPNTTYATDAAESLSRGDLTQMSFAFNVRSDEHGQPVGQELRDLRDGTTLRVLTDVSLSDVSIVAYPAYDGTEAALRAVEARRAGMHARTYEELRGRLEAVKRGW